MIEKNTIKVAFFGTSDRSIPILNVLNKNFDLVLCVTKSDSKVGRHQILKETGVKKWAKENRVNYVTTDSINPVSTEEIATRLIELNVEIAVVTDFSFIIPEKIINTPKYKMVNIHFSLLPKYRGANPVQAAILNGDKKTGITYYVVDKGLDTGPVLHQIEYELSGKETSGELYERLFEIAAENLPNIINGYIEGKIIPQEQNHSEATYCYSKTKPKSTFIYKEDAQIDWSDSVELIERQVRAYNPWPIAWTTLLELEGTNKVFGVNENLNFKPKIRKDLKVKIYEAEIIDGKISIKNLQVEGGKIMSWQDFINGYLKN